MLRWRILLGGIFIGCLAGLGWLDHILQPRGLILGPLAVLLTIAATGEFLQLLRAAGARPAAVAAYFGAALPVVAVTAAPFLLLLRIDFSGTPGRSGRVSELALLAGETLLGPALLLSVVLCSVAAVRAYDGTRQAAIDFASTVFAVTYIGGTVALLALLRLSETGPFDRGLLLLIATVAIVKAGDIGAYTVGRLFGRRKLAPRLSPGKTWEGAGGAVLFSCGVGLLMYYLVSGVVNGSGHMSVSVVGSWLVFSAALAAAGMLGDLAESLLKRSANVKDSSAWMPGYGGVLDVLDSLLLAAPVAYLFARFGLLAA